MRKLLVILSALILGVALVLPSALPVAAAPGENQPVSWVSWQGNATRKLSEVITGVEGHFDGSAMVMKLSDGTIRGHLESRNFITKQVSYCIEFTAVQFTANTAVIEGWFHEPLLSAEPVKERYTLIDNGEPAVGNDMMMCEFFVGGIWITWGGFDHPMPLATHGNIQVHNGN